MKSNTYLLNEVGKIANSVNYDPQSIAFRLTNILAAIQRAKKFSGGIIIAGINLSVSREINK